MHQSARDHRSDSLCDVYAIVMHHRLVPKIVLSHLLNVSGANCVYGKNSLGAHKTLPNLNQYAPLIMCDDIHVYQRAVIWAKYDILMHHRLTPREVGLLSVLMNVLTYCSPLRRGLCVYAKLSSV